jgi:hypothetical protein
MVYVNMVEKRGGRAEKEGRVFSSFARGKFSQNCWETMRKAV